MKAMSYLQHPFGPLYNENSRVLILGSFPSVKSREQNFFYGHPWDSIAGCEITGSSDASIRKARANDIGLILDNCDIERIYCNGRKSHELYCKYIEPQTGRAAACLPSTSPANAQWTLDRLIEAWSVISDVTGRE